MSVDDSEKLAFLQKKFDYCKAMNNMLNEQLAAFEKELANSE